MRAILTILMTLFLFGSLAAFEVHIISNDIDADIKRLISANISIDGVDRANNLIKAYVRGPQEYQLLLDSGFDANALPNPAIELARELNDPQRVRSQDRYEYYSFSEYASFMEQTASTYPEICSLHNIGQSGQGRPLYFMKITDNPQVEEAEPRFRYISSIHGDEVVGYDMMIRLIQLLTSEYDTNPRITQIVNNTEIWICPMMNPDGFILGQRYNASGIDLNRNFPMPSGVQHPDGSDWAPENVAFMNHANQHNFQLSANFHGGELVINYPWDFTYTLTPDNDLIHEAALTYARQNSTIYNSTGFPQGVVNGAQWYVITGSLQDWSYGYTDCIDLTCEISLPKWPPASVLGSYWNLNKESILSLLEFVQRGVHGTVVSTSGVPLTDAIITVGGNDKQMHVGSTCADYHRLLLPGSYTITASAFGYVEQSVEITIDDSGVAFHDFVLRPAETTHLVGQLRHPDGTAVPNVQVILDDLPPVTTDANGSFLIASLLEGRHNIIFMQDGAPIYRKVFDLDASQTELVFILASESVVFYDPFDDISNWTPTLPWGITSYQGESVLTDSPTGNYENYINKVCKLTNPVNLQQVLNPVLSFRTRYFLETDYDFVYLEASTDQTNWQQLKSFTGSQSAWQNEELSLDQYSGQQVYFRFRIRTDRAVNLDGIYIDDFKISGIDVTGRFFGDPDGDLIVCQKDALIILEYCVGLDPAEAPRPWSQEMTMCCDVSQDNGVDALDAQMVLRYIREPLFRFPAQTSETYTFPNIDFTHEYQDGVLSFAFDPAEDLLALQMQIFALETTTINDLIVVGSDDCMWVINPAMNTLAIIRNTQAISGFDLGLQCTESKILCNYLINGHIGSVEIPLSSPNDDSLLPNPGFSLRQNHPNPFNPVTTIHFSIEAPKAVTSLKIYNLKGQLVRTLVEAQLAAGEHQRSWNGLDDAGNPVSSGIYLYRLKNANSITTKKMVLSK
ncbi:MAG TPA: M14 family zinc carboxypeptidase [Candidatus Cloacimonadota bacterium]|nr:M14 family zinc carboxypeptidase [Candidatus Cloacimonadota bacterium]